MGLILALASWAAVTVGCIINIFLYSDSSKWAYAVVNSMVIAILILVIYLSWEIYSRFILVQKIDTSNPQDEELSEAEDASLPKEVKPVVRVKPRAPAAFIAVALCHDIFTKTRLQLGILILKPVSIVMIPVSFVDGSIITLYMRWFYDYSWGRLNLAKLLLAKYPWLTIVN